jgi:TM2 domain-containing membrane protein YozV
MKSKVVAYSLWFLLGVFSAHRFYLKQYGTAIFFLLTFQLFGIAWVFDLFLLSGMVDKYNLTHGFYDSTKGLEQGATVSLVTGIKPPKSSHVEQQLAS